MAEPIVETPPAKETPTPPVKTSTDENVETPPEKVEKKPPVEAPKPPEVKPSDKTVPEKYDLKLPEDSLLDESVVKDVADFAKKNGLSNEDAQGQLDRRNADVQAHVDGEKERLAQQSEDWITATKADPEIGGEKFDENVELAKRGLEAVSSPGFRQALVDTGLGNHPEVIRTFRKVGQLIGDDKLVDGKRVPAGPRSQAERLYGKKPKDE